MLLKDARSKEEVAQALEDDDEELAEDIQEQLDDASRWWRDNGYEYIGDDETPVDFRDLIATNDRFVDEVISDSPSEYDLTLVPRSEVESSLKWAATHPGRSRHGTSWGPFSIDEKAGFFAFGVDRERDAQFPDHAMPKNSEYIPEDLAEDFWASLSPSVAWSQTTVVEENFGWVEGERIYVTAQEDEFTEWCRDLISEYVQGQVKADPKTAIEVFVKGVTRQNSSLGAKLLKAELPEEEMTDFAVKWFESEDDREEVLATLKDYFKTLESGVDEPREVIREWTQDDLRAMGIRRGPLFEEAPWRLIKLHPADLRLEGTLMRHCVGDKDMGYIKAMSEGEIEVWSLRSRANKPRFTLEVDSQFYEENIREAMADKTPGVSEAELRAENIKQLKGKANRLAGFADAKATSIKFPDEIVFWDHALREMKVDPDAVVDLRDPSLATSLVQHARPMLANRGEVCTGFDMPYRPL